MKKQIYVLFLCALFLGGCKKNEGFIESVNSKPLQFSSLIVEDATTISSGTGWVNGDRFGVFAIKEQTSLQSGNIIDGNDNIPFYTTGNGIFNPQGKIIYYPQDGSSMDLIAYFPYKNKLVDYNYPIDISGQMEFYYSINLKKRSLSNIGNNTLEFGCPLPKIIFNVLPGKAGESLDGLTARMERGKTKGIFSLSTGILTVDTQSVQNITLNVRGSNAQKQITAIVLPSAVANELKVLFLLDSISYTWMVPVPVETGKVYRYSVNIDRPLPTIVTSSGYMEVPQYASAVVPPNALRTLHMVAKTSHLNPSYTYSNSSIRSFTVMYDRANRVPYWIAYPMHPMYLATGNRTDNWQYDPLIPAADQPNLFSSWVGTGLDRGHLLASADRNASRELNKPTFYFSNMSPQNSRMNQGTWSRLEERVRYWCKQTDYDTLYVVTGCILPQSPEPINYAYDRDGRQSVIPKYLYKALLRQKKATGTYSSIVFRMENANTGIEYTDAKNIASVAELEQETGFTFFPNLPVNVAAIVKQNKTLSPDWN